LKLRSCIEKRFDGITANLRIESATLDCLVDQSWLSVHGGCLITRFHGVRLQEGRT
jgi:hypothetical protein